MLEQNMHELHSLQSYNWKRWAEIKNILENPNEDLNLSMLLFVQRLPSDHFQMCARKTSPSKFVSVLPGFAVGFVFFLCERLLANSHLFTTLWDAMRWCWLLYQGTMSFFLFVLFPFLVYLCTPVYCMVAHALHTFTVQWVSFDLESECKQCSCNAYNRHVCVWRKISA